MSNINEELFDAVHYGDIEIVRECLENGADVNYKDEDNWTLLHEASSKVGFDADIDIVQLLLDGGAEVNVVDKWGWMPIHMAAVRGEFDTVKLLLEHGADGNVKGGDVQKSALDLVIEIGDSEMVTLIQNETGKSK